MRWARGLLRKNPLRLAREVWAAECNGYPWYELIAHVLEHGLAVTHPDQRPEPFDMPNHGSCAQGNAHALASAIIAAEFAEGLISQPPPGVRHECRWIHPLGCVPKGADAVRVIHDFSSPAGQSVNDRIDYAPLSFDKVDAAFAVLRLCMFMAKIDIRAFFRHIPMDPADWGLLAFRWDGVLYVDMRLNFGARNAPEVAARFSYAVLWAVHRRLARMGGPLVHVFVVCDDWLILSACRDACARAWRMVQDLLLRLGFALSERKLIAPTQRILWLWLELDSTLMTVRLPADKVAKALASVRAVGAAASVTRRELDSVFGYLSFCSGVVYGGRAFLHGVRRLRFRNRDPRAPPLLAHERVAVDPGLRADMAWWSENLELFNGDRRAKLVSQSAEHRVLGIQLDARGGDGGVGVWFDGAFIGLTCAECNARYPAGGTLVSPGAWVPASGAGNHWEMFAFCVLLDLFGDLLVGQYVEVESDSMSAIKCVRELSAALDSQLAALTRTFLGQCVRLNMRVLPLHVAGVDNVLADPLSRDDCPRFGREARAWLWRHRGERSAFLAQL